MSNWQNSKPPLGAQINWNHPLSKGLVGAWLMNEGAGNTLNDLVNKLNATNYYNVTPFSKWKTTNKGKALDYTGAEDYYSLLATNSKLDITKSITITALVSHTYTSTSVRNSGVFTKDNAEVGRGYGLYYEGSSYKYFCSMRIGGVWENAFCSYSATANKFYFIVATYDGSNIKFYVNGVLEDTEAASGDISTNTDSVYWAQFSGGSADNFFKGLIASTSIYNRALSASEIKDLYISPYQFIYKPRKVFYSIPTGVGTWGHKIYGINNTNIGKVNQIDKSNINKVNNA